MNQQTRVILKDGKRKFNRKKANARRFTANKHAGVLGQTSEGTQWVLGESDVRDLTTSEYVPSSLSLKPIE